MAAKGTKSKADITAKILEVFDGAFLNDKELRIPMSEDGELVEIKVALTTAKTNVGGQPVKASTGVKTIDAEPVSSTQTLTEPTAEEKKNLSTLLDNLGLNF